jgi:hypothetical protein
MISKVSGDGILALKSGFVFSSSYLSSLMESRAGLRRWMDLSRKYVEFHLVSTSVMTFLNSQSMGLESFFRR